MQQKLTKGPQFYQNENEFFEFVPFPDVTNDVTTRRIRLSVEHKNVGTFLLQRHKQRTEKKTLQVWRQSYKRNLVFKKTNLVLNLNLLMVRYLNSDYNNTVVRSKLR